METVVAYLRYSGNGWTGTEYLSKEHQSVFDSRTS